MGSDSARAPQNAPQALIAVLDDVFNAPIVLANILQCAYMTAHVSLNLNYSKDSAICAPVLYGD